MTGDDDVITASEYNPAMTSDDHVMHESVHADIPCYITLSNATSIPEKRLEAPELLEEKLELARIPTCAVFHKLTPGKGVPHSFIGFIRQWPALPRVVVSSFPLFAILFRINALVDIFICAHAGCPICQRRGQVPGY